MRLRCFYPHLVSILLLAGYSALILSGVKQFGLGSQEEALIGRNPIELLLQFHPHALRYVLVWPAITLAQGLHIDINLVFSFYVLLIAYGVSYLLQKILQLLLLNSASRLAYDAAWYRVVFLALWLAILWKMNGRGISEFFGMEAILYGQLMFLQHKDDEQHCLGRFVFWQFTGLMFASISTGTFTVTFWAVALFMISHALLAYRQRHSLSKRYILTSVIFLLGFLPFETQYLLKNICFFSKELTPYSICRLINVPGLGDEALLLREYPIDPRYGLDGTIGKMLRHSPAYQLIAWGIHPYIALTAFYSLFVSGLVVAAGSYYRHYTAMVTIEKTRPLFASIGVAMVVGTFGMKSLLMMLPALMLLAAYYYLKAPGSETNAA